MLKTISLQFGASAETAPCTFDAESVTVIVGPNNSGKSLLLRELESLSTHGPQANMKIVKKLDFNLPTKDALLKDLNEMTIPASPSDTIAPENIKYGKFNSARGSLQFSNNPSTLFSWSQNPQLFEYFIKHFISIFVARFGGKERFALVTSKDVTNLKGMPTSTLMRIFIDDDVRLKIRELIHEAFGKYFVVDPTDIGKLQVRFADRPPTSSAEERGWHDEAVAFHKQATPIEKLSDGVQAFTGLIMAVVAGDERILLVDEPEAFLHPSLANILGKKLSVIMGEREGNLIVSTHSPFFLMGCLQAGKKLNVLRLTYDQPNNPTARVLPAEEVTELFKNPLLRSTGVLQALFHSNVVVTEGDADRAFYNEINERLQPGDGIKNCLFLNAQSKQTVCDIVKPLRKMGIPAAAIVDIDFIKDGGNTFTKALTSLGVPEIMHTSFGDMRSKIKIALEQTGRDMKREGGISLLSAGEKELAEKFIADMSEYGLFIIPHGELESWLKHLNCTGHGPSWIIQMFTKLGANPSLDGYVKSTDDDIWKFIKKIGKWSSDPKRKGIPL